MDRNEKTIVVTTMHNREKREWQEGYLGKRNNKPYITRRLLRNTSLFAVVSLCLCGVFLSFRNNDAAKAVMSHMTSGFEYDDTLGRLQFVSNLLPESAMVFMNNADEQETLPAVEDDAQVTHVWSPDEPWIEYACIGDVFCCQDGEIMTIVKNNREQYTVRVLHENGYESVYSGLSAVNKKAYDYIKAGEQIGTAAGGAAFELRKDGLSVQPVFAER